MNTPPTYLDPRGIRVPANVAAIIIADFELVTNAQPLPVFTDTPDPDMATRTPPMYFNPSGIEVLSDVYAIILSDGTMVGPGNPLPTTGGGGGPISADMVSYTNPAWPSVTNAEEALDLLFDGAGMDWPGVMLRISIGV